VLPHKALATLYIAATNTSASCYRFVSTLSLLSASSPTSATLDLALQHCVFFFFFDREKKKKKKREGGGQREIRYHRDLLLIKEIFVIKGHIYMSAIDITDKEEYQSWATLSSTVSCCSSA
jgi:hypothetical protein